MREKVINQKQVDEETTQGMNVNDDADTEEEKRH